ncbi:MAG: PHP domain-containing protein [Solirubrobacteraceae bacterium]
MAEQPLTIAQVSPFALEAHTQIGRHVERLSEELHQLGHRVLLIAPSMDVELVDASRAMLRETPKEVLARASAKPLVLGVGEVLPFSPSRRRKASVPVDVARTIEGALSTLPLDIVHVHEPFAPSASSVALRTARALSVATFHNPTEHALDMQLGKQHSLRLFSRLDARVASSRAVGTLMQRYFPGAYEVILPAADPVPATSVPRMADRPRHLVLVAQEERGAVRTFLRALRLLETGRPWHATVWSARPLAASATLSHRLAGRVRFLSEADLTVAALLAEADALVLGSDGQSPAQELLLQALVSGVVPVATSIPVYAELLDDGRRGLQYTPGDADTLAAALKVLTEDDQRLGQLRTEGQATRAQFSFRRAAENCEQLYLRLAARRHDQRPRNLAASRIVESRPLIDVDLHMHTDHSYDCATPVEVLISQARAKGLGAIAVTEHNEISGALEAVQKASGRGLKVIVGEEVKTGSQGEVIGLFLNERIPPGMTLQETIAEIRRQGGLVYVPHPFDRMHSVPDYENLLKVIEDIDLIETFNPRVAISEFNAEAVRFAAKYRIVAGAGSDAHVPQGLGSVRIRMHDFDGPEQFLESLRSADIIRNPASLLYVQALKFLQTKAMPAAARDAARQRRVRRAARK